MLSNQHFYYGLLRKYVALFGNMFNNIIFKRIDKNTKKELERFRVPILYGPKDKYYVRLRSDIDLNREVQITLPRISYEMTSVSYDASRKQNSLLRSAKANSAARVDSQYMGVPYDIGFDMIIYTRNIDDGNQIVEQILPYFTPDYTITTNPIPEIGVLRDIPIILNSVSQNTEHEGNFDSVKFSTWTLSFTMKVYFFGPISSPKIIRTVFTNIFNDPSLQAGYVVRINTGNGNHGTYKIDDIVYQGNNYTTASAYGYVQAWNANTGKLIIAGAQGQFKQNVAIRGASTNANYTLVSFDSSPLKLAEIKIEPNPIDAEPTDDHGYTTTITEWPETE